MDPHSFIMTCVLIVATLPFVVAILSAFNRATRVRDIGGYFFYDRELDVDGFLKSTVGYSLQVASITLFFYWTFNNGIVGSLLVCLAWASGYWLMSFAVGRGVLAHFLGTSRGEKRDTETIHGFIGERTKGKEGGRLKYTAVLFVSLASVMGLGGTMMAEIDYSTQFFMTSAQIIPTLRVPIELAIVTFAVLYVMWGGFRSSVFIDRYQTPIAYVAFSLFGLAVAATTKGSHVNGLGLVIVAMMVLFSILLWRRVQTMHRFRDYRGLLIAVFTFVPIIVLECAALIYLSPTWATAPTIGLWNFSELKSVLFRPTSDLFGFGFWGTIALVFANSVWQFIDISSLQRLQALDKKQVENDRKTVARAIFNIGVETGTGWFLIALTAILLMSAGLNEQFIPTLLGKHALIVPIFVFTVVIYMLSTICGFISALSYISYYDIVPSFLRQSRTKVFGEMSGRVGLQPARAVTVLVIAVIFVFYLLLRFGVPDAQIPNVLYAIYAFQIAILPSAFIALLFPKMRVDPVASIASVIVGIFVAGLTATNQGAWVIFQRFGMDANSWGVFPPLASAVAACITYALFAVLLAPIWATIAKKASERAR